ncbi:MAG: hydrogenase maturation protease [bacterium]|nr:hydrogenase maturation protease [bacterium]
MNWRAPASAPSAGRSVPKPQIVVGLGNEIVRDDGVGILAAQKLEGLLRDRDDVEVVPLPWAGFSLLDVLAGRRRAAIIDCLCSGEHPPGTIVRLDETDFRGSVRLNSCHDINFPTVLALGRSMGWTMPEEIAIWAVEGEVIYEFGVGLSPPVLAAVDRVAREVVDFLDERDGPEGAGLTGAA